MTKQSTMAEALKELQAAHTIIQHALNLMTPKQKAAWALQNESAGVDGEGATRANERESLIRKLAAALENESAEPMGKNGSTDNSRAALEIIVALADDGFSDIKALSTAALMLFEREKASPTSIETIAALLDMINGKADEIDNLIACESEQVGCFCENHARSLRENAICSMFAGGRR